MFILLLYSVRDDHFLLELSYSLVSLTSLVDPQAVSYEARYRKIKSPHDDLPHWSKRKTKCMDAL